MASCFTQRAMIKLLTIILFMIALQSAMAGDYMLYISNVPNSACAEPARKAQNLCKEEVEEKYFNRCMNSNPIENSKSVAKSLKQYFSGQKTDIAILGSAFTNGHFHFCGNKEVDEVYQILVELKEKGASTNKSHLGDFIKKIEHVRKRRIIKH